MYLTNDMVPIHIREGSCSFVCPLPKGYKEALKNFDLKSNLHDMIWSINLLANEEVGPFVNIMIGCPSKEQFVIKEIGIDERGLYMATASGEGFFCGDIFLNNKAYPVCDYSIIDIADFFDDEAAFECHNVDYYWQALLLRELAVEYFNLLIDRLKEKEEFN